MSLPNPAKRALRQQARQIRRRQNLPVIGAAICERLAGLAAVRQAPALLLYCALPDELDVWPLTARLSEQRVYLPRMAADDTLTFHRVPAHLEGLCANAYGILEPPAEAPRYAPRPGDVVIVPALMADALGYRLGYGKACYDRFLASEIASGLTALTVVPHALYCERLPVPPSPWDWPTNGVVTEHLSQFPPKGKTCF